MIGPVRVGRAHHGRRRPAAEPVEVPADPPARTYIEESLRRGTQWAVFEPNDEPLWSSLRLNVTTFMQGLFRQGAFQGTTPARRVPGAVRRQQQPAGQIDLGIVNILVGFAPLYPAEFVIIRSSSWPGQPT